MFKEKRLKQVTLVFENCEIVTIPAKYIKWRNLDGITKDGYGINLDCIYKDKCIGWYEEFKNVGSFIIDIDKAFLDTSFTGSFGKTEHTKYDRLIEWKDITQVLIENKKYRYISKFKIPVGTESYHYYVPWCMEDDDNTNSEFENSWQKIESIDNNIRISIEHV